MKEKPSEKAISVAKEKKWHLAAIEIDAGFCNPRGGNIRMVGAVGPKISKQIHELIARWIEHPNL